MTNSMNMQGVWGQLTPVKKAGLVVGVVIVLGLTASMAYWALRVDYLPVVTHATSEKLAATVREIEKLKVPYRVSADGSTVEVPANQLGRVKAGFAGAAVGGASVGFEIFNNSDFSTTEFTQKVNYQRALQGELARTIGAMDGVVSARVHLVLADSGYSRRQQRRPTAAVTVAMQPGLQLVSAQISGIQRLIAASVPDIQISDIAVLDQSGDALTKTTSGMSDGEDKRQLALKQEFDNYLESKLKNLLAHTDPAGDYSISVDATLNLDDVKVTQEEVLVPDDGRGGRATGVLVRERQSQRQDSLPTADAASGAAMGSISRDSEYKVGRRVEQIATSAGGVQKISVAVIARTAMAMDESRIKDIVGHAIGVNHERGDSIAVVVLPLSAETIERAPTANAAPPKVLERSRGETAAGLIELRNTFGAIVVAACLITLGLLIYRRRFHKSERGLSYVPQPTERDVDDIVQRVQAWLDEGGRADVVR